jgi:hypothetical protein
MRALSAHAGRRRDHCDLRHRGQRQDDCRRPADRRGGHRLGARRRSVRPGVLAVSIQDFDDNITRFLVVGRTRSTMPSPTRPASCSPYRTSRARSSRP